MREVICGISSTGRPTTNFSKIGASNLARVIEEDLDPAVPFEAGDGVNGDSLSHVAPLGSLLFVSK
jgi:hypothetical protein